MPGKSLVIQPHCTLHLAWINYYHFIIVSQKVKLINTYIPCFAQYKVHNGVHDLLKVLLETLRLLHASCCSPCFNHRPPAQHSTVKVQHTLERSIINLPYSLKFSWISQVREWLWNFLLRNFKFITDARRSWKLDHENFIHENLFLSRIWQNCEIFKF